MMHPHDNLNLTIGQLKELFIHTFHGKLGAREKMDGFNIHLLNYQGEIRCARNHKDLVDGGFSLSDIREGKRFNYPGAREIYLNGIQEVINWLHQNHLSLEEFTTTHTTWNVEILAESMATTNFMPYPNLTRHFFLHGTFHWNLLENGEYELDHTEPVTTLSEIAAPRISFPKSLPVSKALGELEDIIYKEMTTELEIWEELDINKITLEEYYKKRFRRLLEEYVAWETYGTVQVSEEDSEILFHRIFHTPQSLNLRELRKRVSLDKEWLDSILNYPSLYQDTRSDLEGWVLGWGNLYLGTAGGYLNEKIGSRISRTLWAQLAQKMQTLPEDDLIVSKIRQYHLDIFEIQPLEGIVVSYKDQLYKWTGLFALANRLIRR